MRLKIIHHTNYHYQHLVESALHMAHLKPMTNASQSLLDYHLTVMPEPLQISERIDGFGNHEFHWGLHQPHDCLQVHSQAEVMTSVHQLEHRPQSWELMRDYFRYRSNQAKEPSTMFVFPSQHVPCLAESLAYAKSCFLPNRDLIEASVALMEKIHTEFKYLSQSTHINTPVQEVLQTKTGVCQDFAHFMLSCLRSAGLSARYVSGYMLTQPPEGQPRLIGSDASHAWVSVYLPNLAQAGSGEWFDLDPTNNLSGWSSPSESHVKLAVGRDFADVSPLRGVLQGGASHTLEVGVTVMPM
jgi:transglutaminase-like putative cysteine protease